MTASSCWRRTARSVDRHADAGLVRQRRPGQCCGFDTGGINAWTSGEESTIDFELTAEGRMNVRTPTGPNRPTGSGLSTDESLEQLHTRFRITADFNDGHPPLDFETCLSRWRP